MNRHGSLNRAYRLVWSEVHNAWVVAAETARGRGKSSGRTLIAAALSLSAGISHAAPVGGQVISGAGSISQSGATTTIKQSSQNLSLTWQSFNIAAKETVNFVQPSVSSLAVNRIFDTNGTQILGQLNANGQVWLINPNGVLFGPGAQVNVGGLVASTLNLNEATLNGNSRSFSGNGTGSVINQGTINAATAGYVALLGNKVSNQGVITAKLGTVALGAGSAATLTFSGNSLVQMQVDQSTLNNLAENKQLIQADGGMVLMTAGAKDALLASVVNNTGIIEARTVEEKNGVIVLGGGMQAGTVNVGGTLDASAPSGGKGGFIETSAAQVNVSNDAKVTTAASMGLAGTWLIDPVDFNIAATGGNITGATLATNLGGGNITIASTSGNSGTAGDVNVNDVVAWSANKLTLNAQNNININSSLNGSGTASLALQYGQGAVAAGNTSTYNVNAAVNLPAGNNFSTKLGSNGTTTNYTVITSLGAQGSTSGTDLQGMNGGLAGNYALGGNVDATVTSTWTGTFVPIGNASTKFTGMFDGLGHAISNLTINPSNTGNVGLFGQAGTSSVIRNVGLVGGSVTGSQQVGGLVGSNYGTVSNSYSTGSVTGASYAVGGLVGRNNGTVSNSYATGSVSGSGVRVGGLVGMNSGPVSNTYATGSVTGSGYVGGLVGLNFNTVNNSYSTGSVSGSSFVGGLVGSNIGTVSNSYWNTTTSGQATSAGGTGLTTAQMQNKTNFDGFVFTTTPGATGNNWVIVDADSTLNNASDAAGATFPMLASEYSTTINNAHQLQLMAMAPGASYTVGIDIAALNTGNNKDVWGSGGFVPIGSVATPFTGTFDGQSHTISNLTINWPSQLGVGLFRLADTGSTILNVGLAGGSVSGGTFVGGLAGRNRGTISNSYATDSVTGTVQTIGGLVGYNYGTVGNSYATGNVSGGTFVGGLAGANAGTVSNSYSTGSVTGTSSVGGLIAFSFGTVSNSYWNRTTSGQVSSAAGTSLTTAQMMTMASFTNWDIANAGGTTKVWRIYEGSTAPLLRSFLTPLTITADNVSKTYDGNPYTSGLTNASYSVAGAASSPNLFNTVSPYNSASKVNVGSYAPGIYSNQQGYDISYVNGTLTINSAIAIISLAGTRAYDGTTSADHGIFTLSGLQSGQNLTLAGAGLIPNKNVGTYSDFNLNTLALGNGTGANAGLASNYTLTGGTDTVTITAKALTASVAAPNKTYDGATTASPTLTITGGLVGTETVTATGAATFNTKNVTTANLVTVNSTTLANGVNGGLASNYSLAAGETVAANIIAKALTANVAAPNKTYDGATTATPTLTITGGLVGTEIVTATGAATFNTKDVTTANLVTVNSATLANGTGDNVGLASNYSLAAGETVAASITAKALTASVAAPNKTYDGTATASPTLTITGGLVGTETVTATGAASFNSKNVLTANLVTVNTTALANGGNGGLASNYSLGAGETVAANITAANLVVTGITAGNKVYDATTTATLGGTAAVSAFVVDNVTVGGTGSGVFADKNVGTNKAVTVSGYTLSGADANNYTILQPTGVTASITAKALTASVVAPNKTYDGTTTAMPTLTITGGLVDTEIVTATGTASFNSKNVATANLVTVNSATLVNGTGENAGLASNYSLATGETVAANITAKALTASVSAPNRTYDGTTTATPTLTITGGLVGTEIVTATGTASFNSKNVATANLVTVNSATLVNGTGENAGLASNYSLATGETAAANITALNLAVTGVTANSKVYDTTTAVSLGGTAAVNAFAIDNVTVGGTGSGVFVDKNVGTGKTVTISGYTLSGADAGNYTILQPTGVTANITPATLIYNATPAIVTVGQTPSGLTGTISGFLAVDTLATSTTGTPVWTSTVAATSQAGQYPIDGGGLLATNYVFGQAVGNATALTLRAGAAATDVVRTVTDPLYNNNGGNSVNVLLGSGDGGFVQVQIINGGILMPPGFNPN